MKFKQSLIALAILSMPVAWQSCDSDSEPQNKEVIVNTLKYVLDKPSLTATLIGPENPQEKKVNIPNSITYKNETYSVTKIGYNAFRMCPLTSFTVPPSILYIDSYAIYNCFGITSLTIEDSPNMLYVNSKFKLGEGGSYNTIPEIYLGRNLSEPFQFVPFETLTIGKYVTEINLFNTVYSPFTIISYADQPPKTKMSLSGYLTEKQLEQFKVYVPANSVQLYKKDAYWGQFKNIYALN